MFYYLVKALRAEHRITICQSPPALLLNLCDKYMKVWSMKARGLLKMVCAHLTREQSKQQPTLKPHQPQDQQQPPQLQHHNQQPQLHHQQHHMPDVTISELNHEADLIETCLRIYYEPRVLRVAPPEVKSHPENALLTYSIHPPYPCTLLTHPVNTLSTYPIIFL